MRSPVGNGSGLFAVLCLSGALPCVPPQDAAASDSVAVAAQDDVGIEGVIPDPDLVSNCLAALQPSPALAERARCLRVGLLRNHAVTVDGTAIEAQSDAGGVFHMNVSSGASLRFWVPGDALYANTLGNESYQVDVRALTGVPAHAMGRYAGATTPAIALTANASPDALIQQGLCILDVLKIHRPPDIENAEHVTLQVNEPGFEVYAVGRFTPGGPADISKSTLSEAGRFAITRPGLQRETTIHLHASAPDLEYPPMTCTIRPGAVTFAPYEPLRGE